MALIKCPECGKEISDKSPACIHCGYPVAELGNEGGNVTEKFNSETVSDEAREKSPVATAKQIPAEGQKREMSTTKKVIILLISLAVLCLVIWAITEWWFVAPILVLVILIVVLLHTFFPLSPEEIKRNRDEAKYNGYKYTCPVCGSKRVKYIGVKNNTSSFATTGVVRGRDGNLYECDDCKHKW